MFRFNANAKEYKPPMPMPMPMSMPMPMHMPAPMPVHDTRLVHSSWDYSHSTNPWAPTTTDYKRSKKPLIARSPAKIEILDDEKAIVPIRPAAVGPKCTCINCSNCVYKVAYPVPTGYNAEEAVLWKKISPPHGLERLSAYLCAGEPHDLATIREAMTKYKFKLNKFEVSDDDYYISSEKTDETSPDMISFQLYYHKENKIPYRFNIRGKNIMQKMYEYDKKTNKILSKTHFFTSKSSPPQKCKLIMTFNYDKKEQTLEVTELDTHTVIHTEILTGECWFENHFRYRG